MLIYFFKNNLQPASEMKMKTELIIKRLKLLLLIYFLVCYTHAISNNVMKSQLIKLR